MPPTIRVRVPPGASGHQLVALATVLSAIEEGRWSRLSASFDKLDRAAAGVPEPMAEMLGELADELRQAAAERAELATADGPVAHG